MKMCKKYFKYKKKSIHSITYKNMTEIIDNEFIKLLKCNNCNSNIHENKYNILCTKCNKNFVQNNLLCFIDNLDKKDNLTEEDRNFIQESEKHIQGISANDWNNEDEWKSIDNRAELRMRKVLKYINNEGIHLDIGIGRGDGTALIAKRKKTIGVEYGTLVAQIAKTNYKNVIQANASELPFKDNMFTSITMLDSLEHILNPKQALKEVFRVLKNDGKLIIQTPTKEDFKIKKLGVILNKPYVLFELILKVLLSPKIYLNKYKNRKTNKSKAPQPIEIPRTREYVKKIISENFNIEKNRLINYWNKYKIIQLFSYSSLFICKKK